MGKERIGSSSIQEVIPDEFKAKKEKFNPSWAFG
jgi:hypothetical protein